VTVFDHGSNGKHLDLVVPARPSVALTASWEQPASSNPGETARCAASRTLTLPVVQATPPALRLIDRGAPHAAQYAVPEDWHFPMTRWKILTMLVRDISGIGQAKSSVAFQNHRKRTGGVAEQIE